MNKSSRGWGKMRFFLIFIIIYSLLTPCKAHAFFTPKDGKRKTSSVAIKTAPPNKKRGPGKNIPKIKVLSEREDKEANIYSALEAKDYKKALEITEELLQKYSNDEKLITLALENAMAQKDLDKALIYAEKLLVLYPNSEHLLKTKWDIHSITKDFPNAIIAYEKLIETYPKLEYQLELPSFYMENNDFVKAQEVIEPLYFANLDNETVVQTFLKILLIQEKKQQAYWLIKKHHLEETKDGLQIFGDMAMLDRDYNSAQNYYIKALKLDAENENIKNNLAQTYRTLKKPNEATQLFREVLAKNPGNLEAKIGLGYLEIDKKEFKKSREYFNKILAEKPDYKPARMGIVNSYIANNDRFQTLDALDKMVQDQEVEQIRAQTYYNMGMFSEAKEILNDSGLNNPASQSSTLNGSVNKDADDLRYKIKRNQAITITPTYSFLIQQLAENYKLDINKIGTNVSQMVDGNKNVFLDYNLYVYSSGQFGPNQLNNVTNELRAGVQARPNKKSEYRADIGCKFFEFGRGEMINTDSWFKHYFNDKFTLKAGFRRNNIEQSYLSAVGYTIDGIFKGRAAENKTYLEYEYKFPKQYYAFGRLGYGLITEQNIQTNQYVEGMLGFGRVLYNNPDNKWINLVTADLVSYNVSYQYNLLDIPNKDGTIFGNYFSPGFFTANTLNIKAEGEIKKWRLKYGLKGFFGEQVAITPNQFNPTGGFSPYISCKLNDHITFNGAFNYFNYADVQRYQAIFNLVIRRF